MLYILRPDHNINFLNLSKTCIHTLKLPAGKHTIEIINPTDPSNRVTRTVDVTADTSVTVSHTFR